MIFMESPGSQTFEVQDVPAIVAAAQKAGVKTAIDNTWATPLNFRPLDFGVDFSILAATKYVVGHADALLGSVAAKGENFTKLERVHGNIGFSVGPDDVFLALRGLRTMPTRMKQHQQAALDIAAWLEGMSFVRKVFYPPCPTRRDIIYGNAISPARAVCSQSSLTLCSEEQLAAMLDNMRLFGMGYSWGGSKALLCLAKSSAQPSLLKRMGKCSASISGWNMSMI